jgi:hypothetical protein
MVKGIFGSADQYIVIDMAIKSGIINQLQGGAMKRFLIPVLVLVGFSFLPAQKEDIKQKVNDGFHKQLAATVGAITQDLQKVDLTTVITDKKIYHPQEKVRIFVAGLNHPEANLKLVLLRQGELIYEEDLALDRSGMGISELGELDIADYAVEIKKDDAVLSQTDFSVVEYTFSPLTVEVINYTLEQEMLKVDLSFKVLGVPFDGDATINVTCEYCNGQTIQEMKVTVKGGTTHIETNIGGHTGPFGIKVFTPDGKTASLLIYGTRSEERAEYLVSDLGTQFYASLAPREGSFSHLGMFLRSTGVTASDFQLDKVVAEIAEIKVTTALTRAAVVAVDPISGKHRLMEYATGLDKGRSIFFEVDHPYSLVYILAEKDGELAGYYAVIFRPNPINLKLTVPEEAKSGSTVTIKIGSDRSARCLLAVYDARLDQEQPDTKLGKNILGNVDGNRNIRYTPPEPVTEAEVAEDRTAVGGAAAIQQPAPAPTGGSGRASPVRMKSAAVGKGNGGSSSGEEAAAPVMPKPSEQIEVIAFKLLDIKGVTEEKITLPKSIASWKVKVFAVRGLEFEQQAKTIEAKQDNFVSVDLPAFVAAGDSIEAPVLYQVKGQGYLKIDAPGVSVSKSVTGSGTEMIVLRKPGTVKAVLKHAQGTEVFEAEVKEPGEAKLLFSNVRILDTGESVEGNFLVVYPNPLSLADEVIKGLIVYPFGCAEQTSCKLGGLALAYKAIKSGSYAGDIKEVEKFLNVGVDRMRLFFHGDKGFSLWEKGEPDNEVTAIVLKNLKPLVGIDLPKLKKLVDGGVKTLLAAKVKDNALAIYDERFLKEPDDLEGVVFYGQGLIAKGDKKELNKIIDQIEQQAKKSDNYLYWRSDKLWGGDLEMTCEVLKVIYYRKEDGYFKKGFNYVTSRLVDSRLKTTSDTRALIELLAMIGKTEPPWAEVDGSKVKLDKPLIAKRVKALTDGVLVKQSEERVVNYLETSGDYRFSVTIDKSALKVGDKAVLTITPQATGRSRPDVPLTRVYLPANLAFLLGGGNVQELYEPLKYGSLELEVVAVRPGKAGLLALVHDMYETDKIGIAPKMEVTVK